MKIDKKKVKRYIYDAVSIQNPSKPGEVPMRFTPLQDGFFWTSKAYDLSGHQDYSVKPRQIGFSTLNMCFIIAVMILYPGFSVLWVSQDEENAKTIRRKWDVILDSVLNSKLSGITRSDIKRRNDTEFVLHNGSSISFTFAGNTKQESKGTGRGGTIHFAVFTESAYWPHAREAYEALMPSMEHSMPSAVWDSTPNGVYGDGEFFYSRVQKVLSGKLDGAVHFWPWWTEKRYSYILSPGEFDIMSNTLTPNERHIVDEYGVTINQIKWRRKKIEDSGGLDVFLEIYPETMEEAFRTPGSSVFDKSVLATTRRRLSIGKIGVPIDIRPALEARGLLQEGFDPLLQESSTDPAAQFYAAFYADPSDRSRAPFTLGGDTAEGVTDGDPSSAVVTDRNGQPAAVVNGLYTPIQFASVVSRISRLYNTVNYIEDQSTGPEVHRLLRGEMSKSDIASYQVHSSMAEVTASVLEKNNVATRPALVGLLLESVNKGFIELSDPLLLSQAYTFVRSDIGKVGHAPGCHDDALLAYAISLRGRERSLVASGVSGLFNIQDVGFKERYEYLEIGTTQKREEKRRSKPSQADGRSSIFDIL